MKKLFVFMICIFFIFGCGEEKAVPEKIPEKTMSAENNDDSAGNHTEHLSYEITDNMQINADVSKYDENVKVYEVTEKEFSVDTLSRRFFSDSSKVNQNDNPNGIDLETEDGSTLFVTKGYFDYFFNHDIEDIKYLIQGTYFSELNYQNKDDEVIKKMGERQVVKDILEDIEQIYNPSEDEKIELLNGVELDAGKLLERQKLEIEKLDLQYDIDSGRYHKVDETMIPKDCYYLILGISKNEIPILGAQEPYVLTADEDAIYENTYMEVIADATGIKSIRVSGAHSFTEKDTVVILPPKEACNAIQKKYDMQILTSDYEITRVWLEYVFVPDVTAENMLEKGTLQPYWCFEIIDKTDAENSYADRINAVSGGDLAYGD